MTPWIMLGWLLLTQIAVAFVGRSIGPLAPFIDQSFSLSKTEVGLLPAALFLGQSLTCIPSGWYVDKLGARKMLLILSVSLGVIFLLASFVPWYGLFLLAMVVGGMSYGSMQPTSNRGIIYWFPPNLAGTAMGIKQMGVTAGSALSALILLPLAKYMDWRSVMAGSAILLLIIGALSFRFYRDVPVVNNTGVEESPSFLETFKNLLRNKPLVVSSIAAMGLVGAQLCLTTYLVFYVSDALLYPLVIAGVFLALSEIGGSAGRIVWGVVSDRLFHSKRVPVLMLITILTAICSMITAILPPRLSLWILVPMILLFGFCISGFNGVWMNFAAESVPRKYAGIASGFSLSVGSLGVIFAPPIFGAIVDLTGSYTFSWLFIALDMLVVFSLLIWLQRAVNTVENDSRKKDFVEFVN
jgi:ACS family hexuronate transporter-like MFS transporter